MLTVDPYRAYEESSVAGDNPVNLVVALYQGAVASIRSAKTSLESRDIMARGKAITKAVNIVSELLASLDHEKGGTVSANLQQIYLYVHKRLLEAHAQQRREPLDEAENLLATLLSGWKKVAEQNSAAEQDCIQRQASHTAVDRDLDGFAYGAYFAEGAGAAPNISVAC